VAIIAATWRLQELSLSDKQVIIDDYEVDYSRCLGQAPMDAICCGRGAKMWAKNRRLSAKACDIKGRSRRRDHLQ
jgi:hypothetical protein